jgi:hypothetical protein
VYRNLEDVSEESIREAMQSEECRPEDFLMLAKMLCAKKGMPHDKWEEIFHERERRRKLRRFGMSEDLITEIIACIIRVLFEGKSKGIQECYSLDKYGKPKCIICYNKPYKAATFIARFIVGKEEQEEAVVAVLCEDHFQRMQKQEHGVELIKSIMDAVRQSKE